MLQIAIAFYRRKGGKERVLIEWLPIRTRVVDPGKLTEWYVAKGLEGVISREWSGEGLWTCCN